jgi:hypothetical protein
MNKFRFERSTDKREKILHIFVGLKEKTKPENIQSEMPPQKRAITIRLCFWTLQDNGGHTEIWQGNG